MSVQFQRRRFTVAEYYAMADAGILHEDDRVELIEGDIVEMAAIGSRHAACVGRLTQLLVHQAGQAALVWVQNPVRLSDSTEPQPDFALLRPRDDFYARGHPRPEDTLLIVEVAHRSLGYDREIKLLLYATAGIPEVWIVDVDGGVVEVCRDPQAGRFRAEETAGRGDVLRAAKVPGISFPVARILDR